MAYQEKPIIKLYYKINDVYQMTGIEKSRLRFWEKEFDLKIGRNRKGQRVYTIDIIHNFKRIRYLLDIEGFTIKGAKKKLNGII